MELLRALRGDMIPFLALGERDLGLAPVELVESRIQRFSKSFYLATWVQLAPGVAAGIALTGLQDHHEGVETGQDLRKLAVCDFVVLMFGWLGC